MIVHLQAKGTRIRRLDDFAGLPFLPKGRRSNPAKSAAMAKAAPVPVAMPSPIPEEDRSAKILARFRTPTHNRPATTKALAARLKTDLGKGATDAKVQGLMEALKNEHVLVVDQQGKVTYL
jgi:hypothetical protein